MYSQKGVSLRNIQFAHVYGCVGVGQPNNSKLWVNPTIIEARIKTETNNTWRSSAPMKQVEFETKVVLIRRK